MVCKVIQEATNMHPSHLLICGDFNYPEIDWIHESVVETTETIQPFIDTIQSCYLLQHIFGPTRFKDGNEPRLLDLVFTNEEGMIGNIIQNPGLGGSDHICINFDLNCYAETIDPTKLPNYFKGNYNEINKRLSNINWLSELTSDLITDYIKVCTILACAIDGCIPEYNSKKKTRNIYLTPEAIRKKDLKNKLWQKYTRSRANYDRRQYNKVKNELRALTRKLKLKFEANIAANIKTLPKSFLSYVKSKTKPKSKIPVLTKPDGTEAISSFDKAGTLNKFFSSNFTDERIEDIPESTEEYFLGHYLDGFIITPKMVSKKIQGLNPGKSPGPAGWHPFPLKQLCDMIKVPLAILFQKSLREGVVPSQWLEASVTAIHKKGPKNYSENYRAVSITSILCKLMESIVRDKLVCHMMENKLFSEKQRGFVPSRNCVTNLLICIEIWTEMMEKGHPIDIIYTDFAKAFDRVPQLF